MKLGRFEDLGGKDVFLLTENAGFGGIPRYVMLIAEGLIARGIPVQVAAVWPKPDNWLSVECEQKSISLAILARRRSILEFPRAVLSLTKLIKERRYAIVHTQGHYSGLVGRAAYLLARKPCRLVATLHGMPDDLRLRLFYWLDWRTFRLNHAAIANSQDTAKRLLALGVTRPIASVVLHGVVTRSEAERLRRAPAITRAAQTAVPTIGFVGRLSPEKGADTLIEAAALLKQKGHLFRMVIVGDGPDRTRLESMVTAYGLTSDVLFEGWQTNVESYYQQALVIVVPSVRESLGLTVLEAMLYGCAVIASRVQGIPEIVTDGQTGLLISPQNPGELCQAIERLLVDHSLCNRLGESGQQYVLAQHTIEGMIDETLTVYQQALESTIK